MSQTISIGNLLPKPISLLHRAIAWILDHLLGVAKMNQLYQEHEMAGLSKEAFAQRLLDILRINVIGGEELQNQIPPSGPLVIASNHPFGGIEGVILALLIGQVRGDLKVLANQGLRLFPELSDYFIFTNPLSERDPRNTPSIRAATRHVQNGGALLIFPAGRVAYYHKDRDRVADHPWNRMVARLTQKANATYLPVFVSGQNSKWFYRLGRVYFRFRLLMLARELLNKVNHQIGLSIGTPIAPKSWNKLAEVNTMAQVCRGMSYAQDPAWRMVWPADKTQHLKPLHRSISYRDMANELAKLPANQLLLQQGDYSVYYGYASQIPLTVIEIARLRESVFRAHNEGSGEPLDTDNFDQTYTQLFVVNHSQGKIIGAYRMGQTDKLLAQGDVNQLYLSRMFEFKDSFVNRQQSCLEMGRSFLIPEYQRSFQGLYLLWRGIGAFVCQFPHYRTLYGTVSISKLYDPRSVALIREALVTTTEAVNAKTPFSFELHGELADLARKIDLKEHLSALLASIERDGKDIPILAKHYQRLGAQFHCLGIDSNFNDTPGLLLSVELSKAPEKQLKLYLGDAWQQYRDWNGQPSH